MYQFICLGIVALGALILSACATLNEDECRTVNWQQLGDSDGLQGHLSTRIAKHNKACSKHKLPVDAAAYHAGWRAGIARYCVPQNGFYLGKQGATYRGSCPAELAGAFEAAYRPTKKLYDAEADLRSAERDIENKIHEISRLAESKDPKDFKRLKDVSDQLKYRQNDLPRYHRRIKEAHREIRDYLRANPDIVG